MSKDIEVIDIICENCRWSALEDVQDFHTCCIQGRCILCYMNKYKSNPCERFKPHNAQSKFLKENSTCEMTLKSCMFIEILNMENSEDAIKKLISIKEFWKSF